MKKLMIAALAALLAFAAFGCAAKDEVKKEMPNKSAQSVVGEFKPKVGGVGLRDSKEQVIQSFGTEYQQTSYDDDVSLGEPFVKLHYNNGITVVLGSDTNTVLEIESNSPSISNNLGVKIGDKAKDVLDKYRPKYKEPDSHQGDGKLIGWFLLNDQQDLIIFNFDKSESLRNVNVKPDAVVERIKLTNFKYID